MSTLLKNRVEELVNSLTPIELNYVEGIMKLILPNWRKNAKALILLKHLGFKVNNISVLESKDFFTRKDFELLEQRILETLILDVNLKRDSEFHNEDCKDLSLYKELLKVKVLKKKKLFGRVKRLCGIYKKESLRRENYPLAIQFLRMQMSMLGINQSPDKFYEVSREIDHYEYCEKHKNRAVHLYNELRVKKYHNTSDDLEYFVENSIEDLLNSKNTTHSSTVEFVYDYFLKESVEIKGDYQQALNLITKLYDHFEGSPGIAQDFSRWEIMYEQGSVSLKLGLIDEALLFFEKCKDHLPEEHDYYAQSVRMVFYIEFIGGRYTKADICLQQFLSSDYFNSCIDELNQSQWFFYRMSLLFAEGKYKLCLQELDEMVSFRYQNDQNYLYLKVIEMLCLIELEKFDEVDKNLETLRKYVNRKKLSASMEAFGLKIILKALRKLRNCGFNFQQFDKYYSLYKVELYHEELQRASQWPLFSLVNFDSWLHVKMNKKCKQNIYFHLSEDQRKTYFNKTLKKSWSIPI